MPLAYRRTTFSHVLIRETCGNVSTFNMWYLGRNWFCVHRKRLPSPSWSRVLSWSRTSSWIRSWPRVHPSWAHSWIPPRFHNRLLVFRIPLLVWTPDRSCQRWSYETLQHAGKLSHLPRSPLAFTTTRLVGLLLDLCVVLVR